MGRVLCFELLPFMSPSSDWKRVLRSLGPFVCYGSPQVQVLIISGLLTNLLEWWAALDEHEWHRCRKRKRGQAPTGQLKTDTLLEVMDWCVEHVQRAFLLDDGSESLCMATLDYLDAVVDILRRCDVAWSSCRPTLLCTACCCRDWRCRLTGSALGWSRSHCDDTSFGPFPDGVRLQD